MDERLPPEVNELAQGYRVFTIDGAEVGKLDVEQTPAGVLLYIQQKGLFRHRRIALPAHEVQVVNHDDEAIVLRIGSAAFERLAQGEPIAGSRMTLDGPSDPPTADGPDRDRQEDRADTPLDVAERVEQWARRPESTTAARRDPAATTSLLFVGTARGYVLVEHEASSGTVGSTLELPDFPERQFRISKIGPSPLPGDERRCSFLQPLR